MATLEETKKIPRDYMANELEMFHSMTKLNDADLRAFTDWFRASPHYTMVQDLIQRMSVNQHKSI